ncbi:peptide chain release factor N(5)-glutamine methyltransferase [uncultured Chryseobacterium sp.]|uniref:peptide chain release factor N(5)-glutamine methyltransferase n=1 Tax=uncultured Chryseobacterium sp. TaxID=259322 RepID=UPI00262ECC0A|nr:peptide chain release factor N(5)-glutamine methyltransferase [uncultured Chryseobacterium sp.]
MIISELKDYFKKEISELYTDSESNELFSVFSEKILGLNKIELRNSIHKELDINQQSEFYNKILQLKLGKPFQQILGETEFYGLKFFVDEHVLIPRPETEELLEFAIQKVQSSGFKVQGLKILDIGTGSGIIPIILKKHFPEAEISAIDYSEKALETAKRNAKFHQTEITFIHADYLNYNLNDKYDVIISNPPYIGIDEENDIADSVKEFEPKMALFSPTSDALIFYRKIAKDAHKNLAENGMVFLEINQKLGKETLELFSEFSESELIKDISANDRIVFARK